MSTSVCLYFRVHQPFTLKKYTQQNVGVSHSYTDEAMDEILINKLADECYLPANKMMLTLIEKTAGRFKLAYSISGTALELMLEYRPEVIASFQQLVQTNCVEILAETYYNSLSFLYSKNEFNRQVAMHGKFINRLFKMQPSVFRNTELIYNNKFAAHVSSLGYSGILCEGARQILHDRTPNKLYSAAGCENISLLLRNASLSDDIAFRFDDKSWNEHPLTADKFAEWLHQQENNSEVINLFMDYETFGFHKKRDTGIFDFLEALPNAVLANERFTFNTPSNIIANSSRSSVYDVPETISWEDQSAACCIWSENRRQNNALRKIYSLEKLATISGNPHALKAWGRLQAADYIHYMSDGKDGAARNRSSFNSPGEVFDYFTSIATDMEIMFVKEQLQQNKIRPALTSKILY